MIQKVKDFHKSHPIRTIPGLTCKLIRLLFAAGALWIFRLFCLGAYVFLLLPAFLRVGYWYLTSPDVILNLRYGNKPRNLLDIYVAKNHKKQTPVVIFVTGGVWIIGYKAWGAFMGRILAFHGITAVMPDYRNYPQGKVVDMLDDVSNAVRWTKAHIEEFGGDPDNMFLMGQSAGAHLGVLSLLLKARSTMDNSEQPGEAQDGSGWEIKDIKGYIGVSGPYNPIEDQNHFDNRGLPKAVLKDLFGGTDSLERLSPGFVIKHDSFYQNEENSRKFAELFPRVFLFHGTADTCVPATRSETFAETLREKGVSVKVTMYTGKTHTDPIIEDLVYKEGMVTEDFMTDVIAVIKQRSLPTETQGRRRMFRSPSFRMPSGSQINFSELKGDQIEDDSPRNLVPKVCVTMARIFNPF